MMFVPFLINLDHLHIVYGCRLSQFFSVSYNLGYLWERQRSTTWKHMNDCSHNHVALELQEVIKLWMITMILWKIMVCHSRTFYAQHVIHQVNLIWYRDLLYSALSSWLNRARGRIHKNKEKKQASAFYATTWWDFLFLVLANEWEGLTMSNVFLFLHGNVEAYMRINLRILKYIHTYSDVELVRTKCWKYHVYCQKLTWLM